VDYNRKIGSKIFTFEFTHRDKTVLKAKIFKNTKTVKSSIIICDSFAILIKNQRELSKDFEVEHLKSVFPHSFASEKTLFYIGETPKIYYYREILPDLSEEAYKELYYSER
jgi:hypothetical protein